MKIATTILKDGVAKAIKGASSNGSIPLTSKLGIKLSDGKLRFLTTDAANTLCVIIDKVAGEDVDITVDADLFAKLISKLTCETVELKVDNGALVVVGNGTHKIEIEADENGDVIFPDIATTFEGDTFGNVKLTSVLNVYNINKAALSKNNEDNIELTGYMCTPDRVISTNGSILTSNSIPLFGCEDSLLIPAQLMFLLTLNDVEDIALYKHADGSLYFVTDNLVVKGTELTNKEEYPVEDILEYFDIECESTCGLPKEFLLSVIDRLMLFVKDYDKNCAKFTFTRVGLKVSSMSGSSDETIKYVSSENFSDFSCEVNIPALKQIVSSTPTDTVHLGYGDDSVLIIKEGKVTHILSLGSEDEEDYDYE